MSDGNASLASGGFTLPNRAEVFLFHEVALFGDGVSVVRHIAGTHGPGEEVLEFVFRVLVAGDGVKKPRGENLSF